MSCIFCGIVRGELERADAEALVPVAARASSALRRSGLRCEGVNLWVADGEAAGQDLFHVHLHVVPRFRGHGFGLRFPTTFSVRLRGELDEAAARVREAWR